MGSEPSKTETAITDKPWGREELLQAEDGFGFKKLVISPGKMFSYQYHNEKKEIFYIQSGTATIRLETGEKILNVGESLYIKAGEKHQAIDKGTEDLVILEFSYPYDDSDLVRVEDPWNRD